MRNQFSPVRDNPPQGVLPLQASGPSSLARDEPRSSADDYERGAHLFFIRLMQWGTRNNRRGIDQSERDA